MTDHWLAVTIPGRTAVSGSCYRAASKLKAQLEVLFQVINDWPKEVDSTESYVCELTHDIGLELYESSIKHRLIDVDPVVEAWVAESLAILMQLFRNAPPGFRFQS